MKAAAAAAATEWLSVSDWRALVTSVSAYRLFLCFFFYLHCCYQIHIYLFIYSLNADNCKCLAVTIVMSLSIIIICAHNAGRREDLLYRYGCLFAWSYVSIYALNFCICNGTHVYYLYMYVYMYVLTTCTCVCVIARQWQLLIRSFMNASLPSVSKRLPTRPSCSLL